MRESCTYGSAQGARGNSRPYCNRRAFFTLAIAGGLQCRPRTLRDRRESMIASICCAKRTSSSFGTARPGPRLAMLPARAAGRVARCYGRCNSAAAPEEEQECSPGLGWPWPHTCRSPPR